ncbi:hypothetical protein J6590_032863, partial [Homalodisca vitripennis]
GGTPSSQTVDRAMIGGSQGVREGRICLCLRMFVCFRVRRIPRRGDEERRSVGRRRDRWGGNVPALVVG